MYKIGDFSKKSDIPVRTLRFYDQSGVLIPSKIDFETGYRYYTEEDLLEIELIKILKTIDFSLDEIVEYKNNHNLELFDNKQQEILEQLYLLRNRYKRLTIVKEELSKNLPTRELTKESKQEQILRRKYERRNIRKSS